MDLLKKFGGIMAALCAGSLLLAGCFREQAPVGPAVEQPAPVAAEQEWVEFLTDRYENWLKDRDASIYVDSVTGDTSVIFTAEVKAAEKTRIRPTSVAFKKTVVERMMAQRDSTAPATLGKRSQTRWNAGDFDVKAQTEVHQIQVYFEANGQYKVTPNWLSAAREALVRWNNVPGTHISFTEVTSAANADVHVKCAPSLYGWPMTTWITPDPWVEKDSVEIYFSPSPTYETQISPNERIAFAMIGFGNILNIGFTGTEGNVWETGTFTNIPGTPTNDAQSVFQDLIGPNPNVQFSTNDVRAIQQMYPVWGSLAKNSSNDLISAGREAPVTVATNVFSFQTQGDALYFLKNDGSLWRRSGPTGTNELLWDAGTREPLGSFALSGEWIAVQKTSNGSIHTRKTTPSDWYAHNQPAGVSGVPAYKLADQRLVVYYASNQGIYSRWCGFQNNDDPWLAEWLGYNVIDFQVNGIRLAVSDWGNVYAKDGYNPWVSLWDAENGTARKIYLSNELTLLSVDKGWGQGYFYTYFSHGLNGDFALFANPTNLEAVDVCGDRAAAINYNGTFYIWDVTNWIGYSHSPISDDWGSSAVRITGPMCDHVTRIGAYGDLWAKYSVSTNTGYQHYGSNFTLLQQRR